MDLAPLKIDRNKARPRRRSGGSRWTPWVVLVVVLAGGFLFRRKIVSAFDRVGLPEVEVERVHKSHPAAVGAVRGTAANGYVVASRRAALSADTPGRIVEMNVAEGSVVRKGDVVARLYSKEYRAALERAEAELHSAEANRARAEAGLSSSLAGLERLVKTKLAAQYNLESIEADIELSNKELARYQKLVEDHVVPVRDLDQARRSSRSAEALGRRARSQVDAAESARVDGEAQVELARTALEVAKAGIEVAAAGRKQAAATLEKTEVRAPFDGVVVLKDAEVGEVVSPNSQGGSSARGSVVTMVDFDSLEVQADVPETSLASVELGALAQIYLDAYPGEPYRGRVDRIWPTANRQKATVEVRIAFEERDDKLRPEMGVRVVFLADPRDAEELSADLGEALVLVPEEAVVFVDGREGIFLVERDQVRFLPLQLGERKAGRVVVLEGLQGGERIVSRPPVDLDSGDRIRIKE